MTREKWMNGYYRVKGSEATKFAGIRKHDDNKWYVEIRESATGNMTRYAGIWNTLKEATEEAEFQLMTPAERRTHLGW